MKNLNDEVARENSEHIILAPEQLCTLRGLTIARLGLLKFKTGEIENIENLEPYYLKEFKAKKKK